MPFQAAKVKRRSDSTSRCDTKSFADQSSYWGNHITWNFDQTRKTSLLSVHYLRKPLGEQAVAVNLYELPVTISSKNRKRRLPMLAQERVSVPVSQNKNLNQQRPRKRTKWDMNVCHWHGLYFKYMSTQALKIVMPWSKEKISPRVPSKLLQGGKCYTRQDPSKDGDYFALS